MLSILIPTFNYNISALVSSLHTQAIQANITFEIRVQDDASTKSTAKNKNIETLTNVIFDTNSTNLGRSATRNKLAKAAKYDLLLFLDADVLPASPNYIGAYIKNTEYDVVCGGITYKGVVPQENEWLRYAYGKKKEEKSAIERNKDPYIITAGNFLIKKKLFLATNTDLSHFYGDDILVSYNLKRKKVSCFHIDNPVQHLGLETSKQYIEKSKTALQTIVRFEREERISNDFFTIQKAYHKLKQYRLLKPYQWFYKLIKKQVDHNLISNKPTVLFFDVFRLYHFIKLQEKDA